MFSSGRAGHPTLRGLLRAGPAGALILLLTACATYDSRYDFSPSPVRTRAPAEADAAAAAQTLVSVVGVRYADRPEGAPASVDLRVKIINRSDRTATLSPKAMVLVSAGLMRFRAPTLEPAGTVTVKPGGEARVLARFPLPKNATAADLNGLNYQWTLRLGDKRYTRDVTFTRRPEPPARTHFHTGVGVGHWHFD